MQYRGEGGRGDPRSIYLLTSFFFLWVCESYKQDWCGGRSSAWTVCRFIRSTVKLWSGLGRTEVP